MKSTDLFWTISPYGERRTLWQMFPTDDDWSWNMGERLRKGRSMTRSQWPSPPPVWTYDKVKTFEDMPWGIRDFHIVSDRLRAFLEVEAPGAAQYMPIALRGPRQKEIPCSYWAMNFVRVFDCLDEEHSMNVDDTGRRYVEFPVIDPRRIPEDGVLGLLKEYEVDRIIRDDLRRKIIKEKFVGPQFYQIGQLDLPHTRNFKKVDWSKVKKKDA